MKEVIRDKNNAVETNHMTPEEITVDEIFKNAMAKRQPCKSLIEEIMEDTDEDDDY